MDYFEDDDDDDWIFEVDLSEVGVKRKRDEASEEGEEGEMRGGALFEFDLTVGDMPRRWKNVVNKTRHTAQLRQTRDAGDGDLLGNEMTDAVRRALVSIVEKHPNLRPDDRIHFTMQSNAFAQKSNHCFQSTQFRVAEVKDEDEASARFDTYMLQLSRQLNSSQSFSPGDAFTLDATTIRMPEEGGKRKKYDVVKARVRDIQKRSRIVIDNADNTCCARAIVTMRAWADEQAGVFPPSSYNSLRPGLPCQKLQALGLARQAGGVVDAAVRIGGSEKDVGRAVAPVSNQGDEDRATAHDRLCGPGGPTSHPSRPRRWALRW